MRRGEQLERGDREGDHVLLTIVEPVRTCCVRSVGPATATQQCPAGRRSGSAVRSAGFTDPPRRPSFTAVERARYMAKSSVAPRMPSGTSTAPAIQARLAASVYTTAPPT